MTNLSRESCFKLRDARRSAGLSQSAVASEMGCTQSAISMFEQGDGTKLNDEVIAKLAKKFGVELRSGPGGEEDSGRVRGVEAIGAQRATGYCPNPRCPSHTAYAVDGKTFLKPNREEEDPVGGKFCAVCGEVLERFCPNCGSPVHDGAVCSICGRRYVAV